VGKSEVNSNLEIIECHGEPVDKVHIFSNLSKKVLIKEILFR